MLYKLQKIYLNYIPNTTLSTILYGNANTSQHCTVNIRCTAHIQFIWNIYKIMDDFSIVCEFYGVRLVPYCRCCTHRSTPIVIFTAFKYYFGMRIVLFFVFVFAGGEAMGKKNPAGMEQWMNGKKSPLFLVRTSSLSLLKRYNHHNILLFPME